MKNNLLLAASLITFSTAFSQTGKVGIGTSSPESSLDIRAVNHNGAATTIDGLLVPRVNSLPSVGGSESRLLYLISDSGSFFRGFHYWDGTAWQPLISSGGSSGTDSWTKNTGATETKLGALSTGGARPAGSEVVIKDTGAMSIGAASPNSSAILDLNSTSKGFLPPRMTSAERDAIVNPEVGLIVFATDSKLCNPAGGELSIYTGAGVANGWRCVGKNENTGSQATYTSSCASAQMVGTLSMGNPATSTITMTVDVTSLGNYSIQSNIANGVQFSANGAFTTLGSQTVTLYAMGTPASAGTFTWSFNAGGSTCSVSSNVINNTSTRILRVLSLTPGYTFASGSAGWVSQFINSSTSDFGPSGLVKFATAEFVDLNYSTINDTNLASTFSQFDIIFFTGENLGTTWSNATEDAFVAYLDQKKSVVIMEGGNDYAPTADWFTILGKMNITHSSTATQPSGYMKWGDLSNFQALPITGPFGNVTGSSYTTTFGQTSQFFTTRTDLAFLTDYLGTAKNGFWDPNKYLFYTADDDGFSGTSYIGCSIGGTSLKSSTKCAHTYNSTNTTIKGARWLANLVAFAIEKTPPKAYTTD